MTDWAEFVELDLAEKRIDSFSYLPPSQNDWYSFETAEGRRTKPHMLQTWEGDDMVFACGVRTDARRPTCAEPILFGIPEFGLPATWPLRPDIERHEQELEPGAAVRLPPGACALCAHAKEKDERAWYDKQAQSSLQLNAYARLTLLGHVKLTGLIG